MIAKGRWAAAGLGALLASVAVGLTVSGTLLSSASVSAVEYLAPNRVTAVTIDVEPGAATVGLIVDNMAPGDRAVARLDIENAGSGALRYALTAATSDTAVADYLSVDIWLATDGCSPAGPPVGATVLVTDQPALPGSATRILGDPTTGTQPGDRVVDVEETDRLCYSVELHRDAPNSIQGITTTHDLTVLAEHDLEVS